MSESALPNALERLLMERAENWRTLADLAVDFAPPQVARAADAAMSDSSADANAVLEAIRSVPDMVIADSPIGIGSVEPESLDFAPVSTITDVVHVQHADLDLDFGAGTLDAVEVLDQIALTYEADALEADVSAMETDGLAPDRIELIDDDSLLASEAAFDEEHDDDEHDDGDGLDVGD